MVRIVEGFAGLSPDNPGVNANASPERTQTARRRSPRRWLILGTSLVAVGLCGLLVAHSCARQAGTGRREITVHAAHGPIGVLGGIPVGYSRDPAGAASAAVNTLQALTQAGQGRVPMDAVETAIVARDPGPHLRASIGIGRDRSTDVGVVNLIPAAVTVSGFSPLAAHVTVWTMALSHGAINPGAPPWVITAWSTHEIDLIWEHGDWKAKETAGHPGPTPEEAVSPSADSPLAQPIQPGFYTFYVN